MPPEGKRAELDPNRNKKKKKLSPKEQDVNFFRHCITEET
jgi:hypothetical protein